MHFLQRHQDLLPANVEAPLEDPAFSQRRARQALLGAYVFRVALYAGRITAYSSGNGDPRKAMVTFNYQKVGSSLWRQMTLSVIQ